MTLLIDNYDSFTYNIFQALSELGARVKVVRNDRIESAAISRLRPDRIIISPGPGRPEDAGISVEVIRRFAGKLPILGVCLGHQAIGYAFGGRIIRAPTLMHGKVSMIRHRGQGVFLGLPDPFEATRYHSLVVDRKSLPASLQVTAWTDSGLIMGLQHENFQVFGVQFHPESILTGEGSKLLANFLRV
ncbi:MAG TPA: aminodeoxychorismate/anthranilate synthase component II [bacterium]|uniref:Anthranilate synthase component 2 n=1 Tax=candidate division TA06 bacterium ADurb.Bin417 TaxID=1852828 RepID=A0A1V5MKH8_UNCT6|nr:MAG: Anthranilate synthase component 2 [candidate division TA06 bacterium ADurb.Bin417]HNQ35009.1 aminodeoxychorismate/anthranilate synthase component II [bacterium]HNS48550.1 aminodeoxychorismate/anthranilate synthase component II [bacterium]